jgi:site-specific recombinase XerD
MPPRRASRPFSGGIRDARRSRLYSSASAFAALVQQFFTGYLVAQRALGPRTMACYRDGMTLFLGYASEHLGRPPMGMQLLDITPQLILAFLAHLEREHHNSVRSHNLRLTALRAFLIATSRPIWR